MSLVPALGLAVTLAGCTAYDSATSAINRGTSSAFAGLANLGEGVTPWGGTRPQSPGESLTAQRVQGAQPGAEPLLPEPGNVWPEREAPRTTLMNPDQALQGIPAYAPGSTGRPPAPVTPEPAPAPRRGAGGPFVPAPTAAQPEPPPPQSVLPSLAPLPPAPARAPGGRVVETPQGGLTPATTSGNVSTFNDPGRGSGTLTRDGNSVIVNRPGEPPQIVPAPR